jgi:hypothetical integral membrane protein (TIGR02206 family)
MTSQEPFVMFGWYHQIAAAWSVASIGAVWVYARFAKAEAAKKRGAWFLAACIVLLYIWITGQEIRTGVWGLKEGLPLHLCDISAWVLFYALLTKQEWAFEAGYYWGLASGIMALLLPEVYFIDIYYAPFFVWHALLIICPMYLMITEGKRPTHSGIYTTLGITALLALPIGLADWLIPHANYMFLSNPPLAAHVLPIPDAPFHIPVIALIGLAVFYLLYAPFAFEKNAVQ